MAKKLIIEIEYPGLGDHLFHSHIPRIAKQTGKYDVVYISSRSPFRQADTKYLVWDLNPFVDGFIDEPGITCGDASNYVNNTNEIHFMDEMMFAYGLDDGNRGHEPEIYYQPKFIEKYNKVIYDPNFVSWVGDIDKHDAMSYFKKNKIQFDSVMKLRNSKALYIPKKKEIFIETTTLQEFCDLIYSSSKLYCLTSGTASLAAALKKPSIAFYGPGQHKGYHHSKYHTYTLIDKNITHKIINVLKKPIRVLKKYF